MYAYYSLPVGKLTLVYFMNSLASLARYREPGARICIASEHVKVTVIASEGLVKLGLQSIVIVIIWEVDRVET